YKDTLGPKPFMGVDITKQSDPQAANYFKSNPAELGKSRRNFLLFPVKFQPPAGAVSSSYATDKVLVYLNEESASKRFNLFATTMLLMWKAPGGGSAPAAAQTAQTGSSVELEDFKQNDLHTGVVTVKFNMTEANGKLRMKVFDAANPKSSEWFSSIEQNVKTGRGVQLLSVAVKEDAKPPKDVFKANTIEVELVDLSGKVLSKVSKQVDMSWQTPR
ncbi:MAG: hypothetical protein AB1813_25035, partial [Verrucomicrobiota bacterium]